MVMADTLKLLWGTLVKDKNVIHVNFKGKSKANRALQEWYAGRDKYLAQQAKQAWIVRVVALVSILTMVFFVL